MAEEYDVIVLGVGAMGTAAVYQLARRGAKVLGIDQYAPPHEFGSSHGDSRITRIACGEGVQYSGFATRSNEIWRELERELNVELLTLNGIMVLSGPGERSPSHGVPAFLDATVEAARQQKLDYRILDTAEIRRRFPAFQVGDGDQAYYDTVSGFLRPERCIEAQLDRAKLLGAKLILNEKVTGFDQVGGSVTVTSANGIHRARQLIVTAGAWLPQLLTPALAAQFRVTRQVLYWFEAANREEHRKFLPENFPVYIWQVPRPQVIYGFPAIGAFEDGVKIATEQDAVTTRPDEVSRSVPRHETEEMYETYVRPFFPGLSGKCVKAKVCLYTGVDNARFILDRHPDFDKVIVASPCSGHGFKHSAGIGEFLAQMALGESHIDARPFGFKASP